MTPKKFVLPLRPALGASVLLALLAGCSAESPEQEQIANHEQVAEESAAPERENPSPREFAGTAWLSIAEDGARYITYIDADGRYRDLRNGDPFQQGEWTWNADGESRLLCFIPDAEGGAERCWKIAPLKDGKMIVTGWDGKRVELERVEYALPDSAVRREG